MKTARLFLYAALVAAFTLPAGAQQGAVPPATTDDTFLAEPVTAKPNLEPAIARPVQEKAASERLAALRRQHGRAPNIVVVVMDDVGWGDPGVYGGGLAVGAATPNMDRLAREGLQLLNTYSQPSCTPTRATLMTGQLPIRTGMSRPMLPGEGAGGRGIDPMVTLPQKLREAGYITRAVGKWHLGAFKEAQPQNIGFDHYYGILTSSDDYTAWREPWRNPDLINDPARQEWASKGEIMAIVEGRSGEEAKPVFPIDNDSIRRVHEQLTNHAVRFIEGTKGGKQPFFLYFATRGAHNDNYPHPDFAGKSLAKYPYTDVIVELDHRIGQLHAALERAGQLENTLIVITSDNGPFAEVFPDTGYTPFRGAKGSSYEGGVRVPGIAYWKGTSKPGRVSVGLFDLTDLYATSLALAGASDSVPGDRYIDSIDQSSFLVTDDGASRRRAIYYWAGNAFMGVRVAEFKFLVKDHVYQHDDTWPRMSPFQGTIQPSLYGGKLFNLLIDAKEEHAMLPVKQPQSPVVLGTVNKHLATFNAYPPAVPMQ
jgi:arylsulfatase A-like enzyme